VAGPVGFVDPLPMLWRPAKRAPVSRTVSRALLAWVPKADPGPPPAPPSPTASACNRQPDPFSGASTVPGPAPTGMPPLEHVGYKGQRRAFARMSIRRPRARCSPNVLVPTATAIRQASARASRLPWAPLSGRLLPDVPTVAMPDSPGMEAPVPGFGISGPGRHAPARW